MTNIYDHYEHRDFTSEEIEEQNILDKRLLHFMKTAIIVASVFTITNYCGQTVFAADFIKEKGKEKVYKTFTESASSTVKSLPKEIVKEKIVHVGRKLGGPPMKFEPKNIAHFKPLFDYLEKAKSQALKLSGRQTPAPISIAPVVKKSLYSKLRALDKHAWDNYHVPILIAFSILNRYRDPTIVILRDFKTNIRGGFQTPIGVPGIPFSREGINWALRKLGLDGKKKGANDEEGGNLLDTLGTLFNGKEAAKKTALPLAAIGTWMLHPMAFVYISIFTGIWWIKRPKTQAEYDSIPDPAKILYKKPEWYIGLYERLKKILSLKAPTIYILMLVAFLTAKRDLLMKILTGNIKVTSALAEVVQIVTKSLQSQFQELANIMKYVQKNTQELATELKTDFVTSMKETASEYKARILKVENIKEKLEKSLDVCRDNFYAVKEHGNNCRVTLDMLKNNIASTNVLGTATKVIGDAGNAASETMKMLNANYPTPGEVLIKAVEIVEDVVGTGKK